MSAPRVQVRAKVYKGQAGYHVIECGRGGFGLSVFCLTREGAEVIKAAFGTYRNAAEIPVIGIVSTFAEAREKRREAEGVIDSVLRSGF